MRKQTRRPKKTAGNVPEGGTLLGTHETTGWQFYLLNETPTPKGEHWFALKLVHPGTRFGRSNLWMSYDAVSDRFQQFNRDIAYIKDKLEDGANIMAWMGFVCFEEWERREVRERQMEDLLA